MDGRTRRAQVWLLLGSLASVALTGCDSLPYVVQLAQGQFSVQAKVESIDSVLASGRLADEDAAKLRLLVKARDYAANTIGLRVGSSYSTFYDTQGNPLAYNLSAARREALVPKTWTFPVVGQVPYLSFFNKDYMQRMEKELKDEGYDTMTYELDAYSTLGFFQDPVRSPMLRRNTLSLVETVIHELLHNTIWRANETVFNESLATFVGRQGAVEFLRSEFGDGSGWPELATNYYADTDAVNAFLLGLYNDLAAYFARSLSAEEKIAGRDAVYQAGRDRFVAEVQPKLHYPDTFGGYATLPTNNAWMLANHRYNLDLDVFRQVYAATGSNWPATLDVFRAAAGASGDPFAYLRDWLSQQQP